MFNRIFSGMVCACLCAGVAHAEWGWFAGRAGAGYTQPVGGINSRIHGGYNLTGGAGVNLGPYLSVLAEYTYQENGLAERFLTQNQLPGGSVRVQSVTVNPVVHFAGDRLVSPYVTGGYGWYRRTVEITRPTVATVTIFDPFWGVFYPAAVPASEILSSYSVNKGGWNAGAGLSFRLGEGRTKLFVEARYHYVNTRPVATELLPITAGFRW